MSFTRPQTRETITQDFQSYALAVGITPTPLSQGIQQNALQQLIVAFAISCPQAAPNNVWIGGANISNVVMNGIEIVAGSTFSAAINNERQQYELQAALLDMTCKPGLNIQFKTWDISNIFLVAVAPTTVGVHLYKGNFF